MAALREVLNFNSKCFRGVRSYFCSSPAFQYSSLSPNNASSNVQKLDFEESDTKRMSKAMKSYMERAKIHDNFIKEQLHQYNIGKRHLANMMGKDPEFFTQHDVNEAIRYLFPSGLYDPRARPMMKHPDEIYPKRKAAEFDMNGRPFHSLFYTSKPNYYNLLHDLAVKFKQLDNHEDKMIYRGIQDQQASELFLFGTDWVSKESLESVLLESLTDSQYSNLIKTMERFAQHRYAVREKNFIMQFRHQLAAQTEIQKIPELTRDESNRPFTTFSARRKRSNAFVKVIGEGTGLISINGEDILYFKRKQDKEQIIFPLEFCNMLGKVDVVATCEGVGMSGRVGSIRLAIAMCLRCFVDAETIERMRLAGLLSYDPRERERKKPGQPGAREKFTWKKR
ncbi:28S ribosomal protein S9, mitochondrial-like [Daphnia pulicaria]|uniref:28S ribosomal protein S9, mitochondrial-like n=1 Tax=Daphnia pulicaria TaxID=35523 RepID=UPI001EEC26F1|nr:28S ribosomal protein S9, mitochondrial-like [Daphnia pulicaria]